MLEHWGFVLVRYAFANPMNIAEYAEKLQKNADAKIAEAKSALDAAEGELKRLSDKSFELKETKRRLVDQKFNTSEVEQKLNDVADQIQSSTARLPALKETLSRPCLRLSALAKK